MGSTIYNSINISYQFSLSNSRIYFTDELKYNPLVSKFKNPISSGKRFNTTEQWWMTACVAWLKDLKCEVFFHTQIYDVQKNIA